MNAAFRFGNELFGTTSQHNRRRQFGRTIRKHVEAFITDLTFFKDTARAQDIGRVQTVGTGLNDPSKGSIGRVGTSIT